MSVKRMAVAEKQWGHQPATALPRDPNQSSNREKPRGPGHDDMGGTVLAPPSGCAISVIRAGADAGPLALDVNADDFVLLWPFGGEAGFRIDGEPLAVTPLSAAICGRSDVRIEWRSGARALILRLPRAAIQIRASTRHGGARRLVRGVLSLDLSVDNSLHQALADLVRSDTDEETGGAILGGIMFALAAQYGADTAFPPSRSITLARAHLDGRVTERLSLDALAGKAGVTAITLQRGFKVCLGMTVAGYSQAVRLRGARAALRSGWESRSIGEIANGAGFGSVTTFSRAYLKMYGETPTQTRISASHTNNMNHSDSS